MWQAASGGARRVLETDACGYSVTLIGITRKDQRLVIVIVFSTERKPLEICGVWQLQLVG